MFWKDKFAGCSFWYEISWMGSVSFHSDIDVKRALGYWSRSGASSIMSELGKMLIYNWTLSTWCQLESGRAGGEEGIETGNEGNANGLPDRLLCHYWGKGLRKRLCWEGKASLSQPEISSIQGWPGHGPAHRSFLSKRRMSRQQAGHEREAMCFSKMTEQHFLLSFPKTNWLTSAARQLADGEVICKRPTWAFSSLQVFFLVFSFFPPAACHLLQCVIVS